MELLGRLCSIRACVSEVVLSVFTLTSSVFVIPINPQFLYYLDVYWVVKENPLFFSFYFLMWLHSEKFEESWFKSQKLYEV